MKNLGKFIWIVALISSCSNLEQEVKENVDSDLKFEELGKVHNDGLSFILENFKADGFNEKNAFHKASELTKEFISNKFGQDSLVLRVINDAVDFEFSTLGYENNYKNRVAKIQSESSLSTRCRTYLNQIYSNLDKLDSEPNIYLKELAEIKDKAKILSDEYEIFIIHTTIEILISSFRYWEENTDKWVRNPNSKIIGKISVSGLAGADAVGATTTAVNMAVNGTGAGLIALGPSGWVAAGAAVAAGGLMSSAGKAIWDLWTA